MKVRTQIIVASAGTVIGGIVLDVLGIVNFKPVGAAAWSGIVTSWQWLIASTSIPRWLLILLGAGGVAWVVLPAYAFLSGNKAISEAMIQRLMYTQDDFHEVRWRWSWGQDGFVKGIAPFCPECDLQIIPQAASPSGNVTMLYCRECRKDLNALAGVWGQVNEEIRMLIERNMRRRIQQAKEKAQVGE